MVSEEGNAVEQTMLEFDWPIHRIQASYDMGWRVRSSGGRYASPTWHSLLIGALKKKVLDSIAYNKKCGTCMRHYSLFGNYDNVKTHKCVKNYEWTSKAMEATGLIEMLRWVPEKHGVSTCTIISDMTPMIGQKHDTLPTVVNCLTISKNPRFWQIHHIKKGCLPEQFITWLQLLKRQAA